jgi:hypothetical protein
VGLISRMQNQAVRHFCIAICLTLTLAIGVAHSTDPIAPGVPTVTHQNASHLPNLVAIHAKVFSGGIPQGVAAFEELKRLGVQTIISVDGATPDVASAKAVGIRYVHLPHGYDGISTARARELAQAVHALPGPIYIHCHHGKHRSPAAAAVACVGARLIAPEAAIEILSLSGTSPQYRGLYESARAAQPLTDQELSLEQDTFVSQAKLPALAETMVAIEQTFDRLQELSVNGWRPIDSHPDLEPAHESLLLCEHYKELERMESVQAFRALVVTGERLADRLEQDLSAWTRNGRTPERLPEFDRQLQELSQNCKACHTLFRDVPLSEQ